MVELTQMTELMQDDIIGKRRRKHDEPPVETDRAAHVTAAPPRFEITQKYLRREKPRRARKLLRAAHEPSIRLAFCPCADGRKRTQTENAARKGIPRRADAHGNLFSADQHGLARTDTSEASVGPSVKIELFSDPILTARDKICNHLVRDIERRAYTNLAVGNGKNKCLSPAANDGISEFSQSTPSPRRQVRRRSLPPPPQSCRPASARGRNPTRRPHATV